MEILNTSQLGSSLQAQTSELVSISWTQGNEVTKLPRIFYYDTADSVVEGWSSLYDRCLVWGNYDSEDELNLIVVEFNDAQLNLSEETYDIHEFYLQVKVVFRDLSPLEDE